MEEFNVGGKQFNSPEEEIAFLKQHIAFREKNLATEGHEYKREDIHTETIENYARTQANEILTVTHKLPEHQIEALVLKLSPEAHDQKMEELLGMLTETGIRNTLSILQALDDAHLTDDFHRFLAQYLESVHAVPGVKEGTPLWKGLDMVLCEITLPEDEKKEKSFKEYISAMEQFYAGMLSIAGTFKNGAKRHFTLEVALPADSNEIHFYAGIPRESLDLFEKQVLGFYSDARIDVVTDDYNIFTDSNVTAGSYAKYQNTDLLPIKIEMEHDPMATMINALSKLKQSGEGASIQFLIQPGGHNYTEEFKEALRKIKEDGYKVGEALSSITSFRKATTSAIKELFFDKAKEFNQKDNHQISDSQNKLVTHIEEKIKSFIVPTAIRIITSASDRVRAESILSQTEAVFNQFTETTSNGIFFHRIKSKDITEFAYDFSFRQWHDEELLKLSAKELAQLFHFPVGVQGTPQLKTSRAATSPAPDDIKENDGVLLGENNYRGVVKKIYMNKEDRVRHMYVIGQTGTGKTTVLKNMIIQDIHNGDGCCFIDPHGSDLNDILANIPKERIDDVIYFDPAHMARPMGLNMLEYDINYPEQKILVVNELLAIFNKLFDMKTAGGPAFEQYFRNSALLVMEDPESGSTLLEIGRVLADKNFRDLKLAKCKNPIIKQFWQNAEQTTGDQSLANFVPYVTNKFDVFVSNDIMRPVISQQKSVFNFREIMDNKKILLVNLSKGRLGEINANLIGLIIVGKIQMAALSRVDMHGQKMNDFYLYIDEFQNVTTDSIASILSEARKYRLSLTIAHQYIEQIEENIRNAVFGNVGSMVVHRVSPENADVFAKQFEPVFTPQDIIKLENYNSYVKMLVRGMPTKPFNMKEYPSPVGNPEIADKIKELSYYIYGRPREEVEEEIMDRYKQMF
jgi:hypothetical protein